MKQILRQGLTVLIAIGVLIAVLFFNFSRITAEANQAIPEKKEIQQLLEVEVISVTSQQHIAKLTSYGVAKPHYELSLTAQVSGQIDKLNINFEPGKHIQKGETIIKLEDSDYQAAVASAENDLASAKLALLEEQRQVAQAKSEWQASGLQGEPDSELVLRQPQLKAAKATVKKAEASLRSARKNLYRTNVIAPFDALVIERHVSPGAYVQASSQIATLYSTEYLEVEIDLSARDWNNLPDINLLNQGNWPVTLFNVEDGQSWDGHVLRIEQHLNDNTRQRSLVIAVVKPLDQTNPLYFNTFLKVIVNGRTVDNLWKLPSSALSQRGEIWYVTENNLLNNFSTEPLFSYNDSIYIRPPDQLIDKQQTVLFHPLSSYLKGMSVKTIEKVTNNG